jgi:hypothetical protein
MADLIQLLKFTFAVCDGLAQDHNNAEKSKFLTTAAENNYYFSLSTMPTTK